MFSLKYEIGMQKPLSCDIMNKREHLNDGKNLDIGIIINHSNKKRIQKRHLCLNLLRLNERNYVKCANIFWACFNLISLLTTWVCLIGYWSCTFRSTLRSFIKEGIIYCIISDKTPLNRTSVEQLSIFYSWYMMWFYLMYFFFVSVNITT